MQCRLNQYASNKQIEKKNWFLLCTIDVFNKYAWVVPLKDKKDITITNIFQKKSRQVWLKTKQNIGR